MYKKYDLVCLSHSIVNKLAAENDCGNDWLRITELDRICEVVSTHLDADIYRLYSVYGKYTFECADFFIDRKLL